MASGVVGRGDGKTSGLVRISTNGKYAPGFSNAADSLKNNLLIYNVLDCETV
jgi:hypothetical protein